MKFQGGVSIALLTSAMAGQAEVPELTALVPEAKNYELIAKFDPRTWSRNGYQVNRAESMTGELKRVGYLVKLTDGDNKLNWVFVSMNPFSQAPADALVPEIGGKAFQSYVNGLEVAGNVGSVKNGKWEKGNIEFWGTNYDGVNAKGIPGAGEQFDFGDQYYSFGDFGSMQVHNYLERETVFAFNHHRAGNICDLGIGNNTAGAPDWTFAQNGGKYQSAEIYVVGAFDNLKIAAATLAASADETAAKAKAELEALAPEAKDYELIAKFDPRTWSRKGYSVNRAENMTGELTRIGYLVKLTDQSDKQSWVFVSMNPFSQTAADALVPEIGGKAFQVYVDGLEVAGNVGSVKNGKWEKGNIEFWSSNYDGVNAKGIPGADDKLDFGDQYYSFGDFGSMQVHNYLERETVFAFNHHRVGNACDLGIGNNTAGSPDWTFAQNGGRYKAAEIYVFGKFNNLKTTSVVRLNGNQVAFSGRTDIGALDYKVGQPIVFTFTADYQGQQPTMAYFVSWKRSGDDGKEETGKEPIVNGKAEVRTALDRPGFVRVTAQIVDETGKALSNNLVFDGGAAVEIDKLAGSPEPGDFDAFWAGQKARLAKVPMQADREKLRTSPRAVELYAVRIDCAGPRPVTGYLTVPAGAAAKSLPAQVEYFGYGVYRQPLPTDDATDKIMFYVNAHGYSLNEPDNYYPNFEKSISTNGQCYAFDPAENSNPESSYFNGMALRLMRSLEYVKSLPAWNGKELAVRGGSQGGLQAIWAAALDQDVTACESFITWCCDLAGHEKQNRLTGGWRIQYVPGLDYYDAVNHAKRIKCPVYISRAGLADYVSPPSGVAILYNNITSPKKIVWYQDNGHEPPSKPVTTLVRESQGNRSFAAR